MNNNVKYLIATAKQDPGYLAVQAVPLLLEAISLQLEEIIQLLSSDTATESHRSNPADFEAPLGTADGELQEP